MAVSTSTLTAYVKENSDKLIALSITSSKTGKYCTWQGGIKKSEALQLLETDAVYQANTGCGFNASGTTSFTQRALTVAPIKVEEAICIPELESKYTQLFLKAGADQANGFEGMVFEQAYTEQKAKKIAKQNELAMWKGDTGSGTAYLAQFNGWLKILNDLGFGGAGDPIEGNPADILTTTGIVAANVIGIVDLQYSLIPEALLEKDDLFIGMGWDTFRVWSQAVKTANLFHYTAEAANGEAFVPGTNVKVIALPGLTGSNQIISGSWSNFYAGTDLQDDADKMEFYFAEEARTHRFGAYFKLGVQIAFPEEVVVFKLVAP